MTYKDRKPHVELQEIMRGLEQALFLDKLDPKDKVLEDIVPRALSRLGLLVKDVMYLEGVLERAKALADNSHLPISYRNAPNKIVGTPPE